MDEDYFDNQQGNIFCDIGIIFLFGNSPYRIVYENNRTRSFTEKIRQRYSVLLDKARCQIIRSEKDRKTILRGRL